MTLCVGVILLGSLRDSFAMSDDRFDNARYYNEDTFSVQATAGAVPVRNKKGEVSMQKVKVSRYISGKRPEYAGQGGAGGDRRGGDSSEDSSSEEEDFTQYRATSAADAGRRHVSQAQVLDEGPSSPSHDGPSTSSGSRWDQRTKKPKDEEEDAAPDMSDPRIRRLMMAKMA